MAMAAMSLRSTGLRNCIRLNTSPVDVGLVGVVSRVSQGAIRGTGGDIGLRIHDVWNGRWADEGTF